MFFHPWMSFGIPLIESMKSEVPIICSDIEILKKYVKTQLYTSKRAIIMISMRK